MSPYCHYCHCRLSGSKIVLLSLWFGLLGCGACTSDDSEQQSKARQTIEAHLADDYYISGQTRIAEWTFFEVTPTWSGDPAPRIRVVRDDETVIRDNERELGQMYEEFGLFEQDSIDQRKVLRAARYMLSDGHSLSSEGSRKVERDGETINIQYAIEFQAADCHSEWGTVRQYDIEVSSDYTVDVQEETLRRESEPR